MTTFSEANITHPAPHRTHTVLNQSVPRTDVNEFTLDTVLAEGVRRHDADWATGELTDIGALVGSATFQHDAELANTIIPPELKTFDRWGQPDRRGRIPPRVPPDHLRGRRARGAHVGVGRPAARRECRSRSGIHDVRTDRTRTLLPDLDDQRRHPLPRPATRRRRDLEAARAVPQLHPPNSTHPARRPRSSACP